MVLDDSVDDLALASLGFGRGIVVLGHGSTVLKADALATRLLQTYCDVKSVLKLPDEYLDARLQALVRAVGFGVDDHVPPPVIMPQDERGGLVFEALPVLQAIKFKIPTATALLLVRRYQAIKADAAGAFQNPYALTAAEIRTARGIVSGMTIKSIAEVHEIAVGTARQQVKAILRKADVSSQSQLVALFARNPFF